MKITTGLVTKWDASIGNYRFSKFKTNGIYAPHIYANNTDNLTQVATRYENGEMVVGEHVTSENTTRIEISTGSAEDTKLKNVYDLAGNMFEYTTEKRENSSASIKRGGRFDWGQDNIVFHWGNAVSDREFTGFRVVLYVK